MSTLATNVLTLADWAKRRDPNDKMARIAEMLSQSNEILQDVPYMEGNLPTGHRTTVRSSLPTVGYRRINEGVATSKSTTRQVDYATALLEAWSQVDVELCRLQGDQAAFRLSESVAFVEAMGQKVASDLFYGNADLDPKAFTGLAPWFASTTGDTGQNVISGGGAGSDNTSIWLVCWGDKSVHGIYPKGTQAGLEHNPTDNVTVYDASGNPYKAHQDQYIWRPGLAIRDWRYIVRIANVDSSNLTANSSAADIIDLLIQAYHRIPNFEGVKAGIYCNRTVRTAIDRQARKDGKVYLTIENVQGKPQTSFWGVPFRTVDKLTNAEATVS